MRELAWSDTLSVAVDEIDDDHRRLVDLFNTFAHALTDKESPDYLQALLEELISCTAWHFKHEERLMLRYGYEGLAEHKQEHQELIESVDEVRQKFLGAEKHAYNDHIEFLESWLVEHILVADMKLGDFLADRM